MKRLVLALALAVLAAPAPACSGMDTASTPAPSQTAETAQPPMSPIPTPVRKPAS